ncbi:MAG: DUF2029 domain-containing protein [Anaerolineaceae bacterium]|nr:DUF2029 domain-containing protein [Anaerolineaceae bacterium]
MKQSAGWKTDFLAGIIILIVLTLVTWQNYRFSAQNPGGADFLSRWMPARLAVTRGWSPYSQEASIETQYFRYGRLAYEEEDMCLFAYPYYTMGLIVPFTFTDNFTLARSLWMTTLQAATLAIVFLSLKIIGFKPSKLTLTLLLIFSLFSSYLLHPIIDGNPSVIAALFITLSLYFLKEEKDILAGVFLGLSTFKPQLVILFSALFWFWASSNRRWKGIISSGITVLLLMGISFLFQPDWLTGFLNQMTPYNTFADLTCPNTPERIFAYWGFQFARPAARVITFITLLVLGYETFRLYRAPFRHFFWMSGLSFALINLSGITSAKTNFIAMLPAFILWIDILFQSHQNRYHWIDLLLPLLLAISWVFTYVAFYVPIGSITYEYMDYFPAPIFIIIVLYSIRKRYLSGKQTKTSGENPVE